MFTRFIRWILALVALLLIALCLLLTPLLHTYAASPTTPSATPIATPHNSGAQPNLGWYN